MGLVTGQVGISGSVDRGVTPLSLIIGRELGEADVTKRVKEFTQKYHRFIKL